MIQSLINRFMNNKDDLESIFQIECPHSYKSLVKNVINILHDEEDIDSPDSDIIHEINDGEYQGTLVYLIPINHYQPNNYYLIKIGYGSCSACDTLEKIIMDYDEEKDRAIKALMTLSLHIVQQMKMI